MTDVKTRLTVVQTAEGKPCIVSEAMHRMLKFISAHPGAGYTEIGQHIGFDRASVNSYASRMDKAKLIRREPTHVDGRARAMTFLRDGVNLDFEVVRV
jgi:DNA-binding MarR family transcriptional regulator